MYRYAQRITGNKEKLENTGVRKKHINESLGRRLEELKTENWALAQKRMRKRQLNVDLHE